MYLKSVLLAASCLCAVLAAGVSTAAQSGDEHNMLELRDTVINLIQALVERGVLTREQAEAMIRDAKAKAEAESAANDAKQKAQQEQDKNAIRVPYVPQIVQDQISKQVVTQLTPNVQQQVAEQLTPDKLRSSLPEWIQRMNWTGELRIRGEADTFGRDNFPDTYLDFNQVNAAGGVVPAGTKAYLNTTEDVDRLRVRLLFGFDTDLGGGFSTGVRLATGSGGEIFVSTNQTLGTYGQGYQIAVDQAWLSWTGHSTAGGQVVTATAGRFANPWLSTNMLWYTDLTFEGLLGNYKFNLGSDNNHRKDLFLTLGAFPLQSEVPSSQDKWLAAAQFGTDLRLGDDSRLRIAGAYYDYIHIVGVRNQPNTTLFNYTAPALVQKGNTMFDIANSTSNPNSLLFGLAANYRIADVTAVADWRVFSRYAVILTAEAVKNVGFDWRDVIARTGTYVAPRTAGYEADIGFGSAVFGQPNTWRATLGYRYLQRDAVLDAFNDEDFHLGGTDTKGYIVNFDYAVNPHVWARLRYLSANQIDGIPFAVDVLMLDLNSRF